MMITHRYVRMSSAVFPGDTEGEPRCAGCNEPIELGVARYPTADGYMHDFCQSIISGPPGVLGRVESGDRIDVAVRRKWIRGTVEHAGGLETGDYVVRVALDERIPMDVSDHVDICTTYVCNTIRGPRWTEPEGFDILPGWDTFESEAERVLPAKHRSVGLVDVRNLDD